MYYLLESVVSMQTFLCRNLLFHCRLELPMVLQQITRVTLWSRQMQRHQSSLLRMMSSRHSEQTVHSETSREDMRHSILHILIDSLSTEEEELVLDDSLQTLSETSLIMSHHSRESHHCSSHKECCQLVLFLCMHLFVLSLLLVSIHI